MIENKKNRDPEELSNELADIFEPLEDEDSEDYSEPETVFNDYPGNNIYDPAVKAAAIRICGGVDPKEACKNASGKSVDVTLAKTAAAKILRGSYFGKE